MSTDSGAPVRDIKTTIADPTDIWVGSFDARALPRDRWEEAQELRAAIEEAHPGDVWRSDDTAGVYRFGFYPGGDCCLSMWGARKLESNGEIVVAWNGPGLTEGKP